MNLIKLLLTMFSIFTVSLALPANNVIYTHHKVPTSISTSCETDLIQLGTDLIHLVEDISEDKSYLTITKDFEHIIIESIDIKKECFPSSDTNK